jgi:serine/threonine-protein kinase
MPSPRYTIVRSLGVGALSEALLARAPDGAHVVIKRLHRHLASDASCVEMFRHEARVLTALSHPNVASLVDEPARVGDAWEFVQACAVGVALSTVTAALRAPMPLGAACEVVAQLLTALEHVHSRVADAPLRVVHRDVCPANLIAAGDGHITLVDFGIATSAWRPDPDRGQMKGTRGYMAPEVITGERDADARSDLWSAGVILYELTLGRRLYEGSATRVMAAVVDGPTPSPAGEHKGYPPALDVVVRTALARTADDRFADARSMLGALDGALAAHGLSRGRWALAAALTEALRALPRDAAPV